MNETLAWWAEVGVVVLGAHRPGPRRLRTELALGHQTVDPEPCFSQERTADGRMLWRGCGCGCQKDLPPLQISPPTLPSSLSCPLLLLHSFRLRSVQAPTWSLLGVPPPPKFRLFYTEGLLSGGWMENKASLSGWQRIGVTGRGRTRKRVASIRLQAGLQTTPNTMVGVVGWSPRGTRLGRGCCCGCGLEN